MIFFKNRKIENSYGLYSGYAYYTPGVKGMFALLGMFLIGSILGSLLTLILSLCFPGGTFDKYMMLVSYPVSFIPPMLYASSKSRQNAFFNPSCPLDSSWFGSYGGAKMALLCFLCTFAITFLGDTSMIPMPPMPEWLETAMSQLMSEMPVWASFICVSIFAPVFEEWLCRGIILRGLLTKMKPVWAIIISALFFAFIHMNPWQGIPAMLFGLVSGYIYYKTGSLKLTMLMHFTNNTTALIIGNIDSLKDYDTLYLCLDHGLYAVLFALAIGIIAATIAIVRRIPSRPLFTEENI
ncbi:MAG: lysostaphin resistance A-like protein [Candidatus Cryptobacteroides sp.]